jgi:predicted RNase H-like nuclease
MGAGLALPDELDDAAAAVAVDDVLDAAVVAWSAMRIARGAAISIPDPPEDDERGYPMAIWY